MECEAIDRLVDQFYKAGMAGEGWSQVLLDTANAVQGAEGAWVVFANPDLEHFEVVSPRSDPTVIADYQRYWWRHDITTSVTSRAPVGRLTTLSDTGRDRFLKSRFYNEFWRHSGQPAERVAVNLHVQGTTRISFGIQPQCHKEELDRGFVQQIRVLVPHLARAAEIHNSMRRLELSQQLTQAVRTDLVLIVDEQARAVFAEDEVRRFIANSASMDLHHGNFQFARLDEQDRFQGLLKSCFQPKCRSKGGELICRDSKGQTEVQIEVMPLQPEFNVFGKQLCSVPKKACLLVMTNIAQIRKHARNMLREQFELTPAEAKVALELLRGDSRTAVAERVGVKLSTVRTHMMHLFEKVGVNSRAELINRLITMGIDRKVLS